MPKLICIMRVKDGMNYIQQWLDSISPLVDEIVLLDNGSTDGTYELIQKHPKVVCIERSEGYHEGRDKEILYRRARERNPDWLITMDVDERFEKKLTREKLNKMMTSKIYTKYLFRRFHLYKDENHFKASFNNVFHNSYPYRMLWKEQETGYFPNQKLHIGPPRGIKGRICVSKFRIKHYSPLYSNNLKEKTKYYSAMDPSRAKMYEEHLNKKVRVWRWYEYDTNPLMVNIQYIIYTFFLPFKILHRHINKFFVKGKIK